MAQFASNTDAGAKRIGYGVVDLELIYGGFGTRFTNNGDATHTAELRVPAGETLTIAEGTSVLFVRADIDSNNVGDYAIEVEGTLVVEGTAAEPVVFRRSGTASASS